MNKKAKLRFSILHLLLLLTTAALALGLWESRKQTRNAKLELSEQNKLVNYLKDEVGYIESSDESLHYIRELQHQIPRSRRYLVRLPATFYYVCAGDYLGGEFVPTNLKKRHQYKTRFRMQCDLSLHVFKSPQGESMLSVDIIDFNSGQSGGGYLTSYNVKTRQLNFSDDQHAATAKWQIINEKPHGELKTYPADADFIPLFILEDHVELIDKDKSNVPIKGLAIWLEPFVDEAG